MRLLTTIFILFQFFDCTAQSSPQMDEDRFNVNHGVYLNKIDSSFRKDIRFVHFDSSIGVIFPAEYGKQKFGPIFGYTKYTFFTPDTSLIKQIDVAVSSQYCIASRRFDKKNWNSTIRTLRAMKNKKELALAKKQRAKLKDWYEPFCPKRQHDLIYKDRQYLGIITEKAEKLIYIQLLDFRKDPYVLRPFFKISWIEGWHGWFETNTESLHFHLEKNRLTINEDL
jgi:hypothetical protein